jgi:hypothetical protein
MSFPQERIHMKKLACAALLALAVALPAKADGLFGGICPPLKIEAGANCYFRIRTAQPGFGAQYGPWYLYWPLDAHFQTPGNPCYPYWPPPLGLPQTPGYGPGGPAMPPGPGVPPMPPATGAPPMSPAPDAPAIPGPGLPTGPDGTVHKAPDVKPIGYQSPVYRPAYYPVPTSQAPAYWYPH